MSAGTLSAFSQDSAGGPLRPLRGLCRMRVQHILTQAKAALHPTRFGGTLYVPRNQEPASGSIATGVMSPSSMLTRHPGEPSPWPCFPVLVIQRALHRDRQLSHAMRSAASARAVAILLCLAAFVGFSSPDGARHCPCGPRPRPEYEEKINRADPDGLWPWSIMKRAPNH